MLANSTARHMVQKSFKWDQISKCTVVKFSSSTVHVTAVILTSSVFITNLHYFQTNFNIT